MPELKNRLKSGGTAAFEIGIGQQRGLEAIAEEYSLKMTGIKKDINGIPRTIIINHSL